MTSSGRKPRRASRRRPDTLSYCACLNTLASYSPVESEAHGTFSQGPAITTLTSYRRSSPKLNGWLDDVEALIDEVRRLGRTG